MTSNSRPAQSEKPPDKAPDPLPGGIAGRIGRALYNLAWYPAFPVALILGGGRAPMARRQRMGRLDSLPSPDGSTRFWLHASSVGEIEAVRPIALALLEDQPGAVIVVTTMTETGRQAALSRIPGAAACRLAPFDHPLMIRAFLAAAAPDVVLISEAELWPNYFIESHRFGARVALVNGRLSDRSLRRYLLMRSLWGAALNCADLLLVQSQADASRYLALGAPQARIVVTGNTKFEAFTNDDDAHPALAHFAASGMTLVAGSTASGEESELLDAYIQLRAAFAGLRLILAPRHLERTSEIIELLNAKRLEYVRASALKAGAEPPGGAEILLLETMGDLRLLYRLGTLAFVGGSLFAGRGGQNLGEPAAAGVAVLFGPFHQNQKETAQALLACGGGVVVRNSKELACAAARLLRDEPARRDAGAMARQAYESLSGGASRSIAELRALMGSR